MNLRYPVWAGEGIEVKVNGTKQKITSKPGSFITLERKWKAGDRIELNIPMNLYTKEMPDNADRRAVFYGPTLLAGALGEKEIEPIRGVPVFVSPDKQVCKYIHPVNGKPLTFETEGTIPTISIIRCIVMYSHPGNGNKNRRNTKQKDYGSKS